MESFHQHKPAWREDSFSSKLPFTEALKSKVSWGRTTTFLTACFGRFNSYHNCLANTFLLFDQVRYWGKVFFQVNFLSYGIEKEIQDTTGVIFRLWKTALSTCFVTKGKKNYSKSNKIVVKNF